jgi:xanthine/uracil permease
MNKLIHALPLLLLSGLSFASAMEEGASTAPAETVPVVFVWLFLAGFVAMIVGFFGYMWWLDKRKKQEK